MSAHLPIMVPMSELVDERRIVRGLADELAKLRATNTRLNRRCQIAEAAANQNVEDCRRAGVPLGRVLQHYRYQTLKRELAELLARA